MQGRVLNLRKWIFFFAICTNRFQQVYNDVSGDCNYNQFMDGNVCKKCPVGYFGRNCSYKCYPPHYGYLCVLNCASSCKTCHFMFGCTITTETKEIRSSRINKHMTSGSPVSHVVNSITIRNIISRSSIKSFTMKYNQMVDLTEIPNVTSSDCK
nr:uncharacterized protein LOC117690233 [Crassostrea gigas]